MMATVEYARGASTTPSTTAHGGDGVAGRASSLSGRGQTSETSSCAFGAGVHASTSVGGRPAKQLGLHCGAADDSDDDDDDDGNDEAPSARSSQGRCQCVPAGSEPSASNQRQSASFIVTPSMA